MSAAGQRILGSVRRARALVQARRGRRARIKVMLGSGNVFADLGLPHAEEHLAKAELASRIAAVIRARGLTQAEAAVLLGVDQPKVSRLLRGYLTNISAERLMHFLTRLGRDVEIVVRKVPRSRRVGRIRVVEAA